ncbi:hypothetical protein LINGRAHAP2_LOCUS6765 [Linum grandiflorum]
MASKAFFFLLATAHLLALSSHAANQDNHFFDEAVASTKYVKSPAPQPAPALPPVKPLPTPSPPPPPPYSKPPPGAPTPTHPPPVAKPPTPAPAPLPTPTAPIRSIKARGARYTRGQICATEHV